MAVNTCDPALHSWVKSAEAAGTDFPIQNLPFGVARIPGEATPRVVTAIGDRALDIHALTEAGVLAGLDDAVVAACRQTTLNALMALPRAALRTLRERLSALLEEARVETMRHRAVLEAALKAQSAVEMLLPAPSATTPISTRRSITRRTSAACSVPTIRCCRTTSGCRSAITAARRRSCRAERRCAGRRARRARTRGEAPGVRASERLDYELEVGAFVGPGNRAGRADPDR